MNGRGNLSKAIGIRAFVVGSVIVLGACQNPAALQQSGMPIEDWKNAYVEKRPQVQAVNYDIDVAFMPGTGTLKADEAERLSGWLGNVAPGYGDQVLLSGAPERLGVSRMEAVQAYLGKQGIKAFMVKAESGIPAPGGNAVKVTVRRYVANIPACPDWSDNPAHIFSNQPLSNFGCATASNLGMMVANPRDLVAGTPEGPVDAEVSARAVSQYRAGKTKDPAVINAGAFEKKSE
ncbi:MAG: CpaD family pilus assembly protein [Rhodospirillales bacterium]|nr:CpaD family pilus assembly protein [Rhodospirillales bacterium]MCW8861541.1 CpaD family pilus assembly protein [Rhodospirillales bacterium]MCW8951510.1 CpaD family pilus assembly protein [Rhodospirillales bacterium]MCW8970709.1 CpaD family pilus assembly protein [Rhodospirillales bacterium]MCW9002791.1 CpaD family pilus assembly protein [Rhodospirillales bacterium]